MLKNPGDVACDVVDLYLVFGVAVGAYWFSKQWVLAAKAKVPGVAEKVYRYVAG